MNKNRDDFTKNTKDLLAKRVGYRCSNPNCRKLTCGPAQNPNAYMNVGVASHIRAAAPGGKRYDQTMTETERKSALNGIWLCQTCSKLIDSDALRYTEELLYSWKHDAEMEAVRSLEYAAVSDSNLTDAYDAVKKKHNYSESMHFMAMVNREINELLVRMEEIREKIDAARTEADVLWSRIYEDRFESMFALYQKLNWQLREMADEGMVIERYVHDMSCYADNSRVFETSGYHDMSCYIETPKFIDTRIEAAIERLLPCIGDIRCVIAELALEVKELNVARIRFEKVVVDFQHTTV